MDLVYMPEVLTYGALRAPVYRDYEQPWNQDRFNYQKSSAIYCQQQSSKAGTRTKHNCHLCKESKRRSLGAYIRSKTRLNSCSEISEEEAEEASTKTEESVAENDVETSKVAKIEK